ncbi:MAG: S8 family serine peptidase [Oscillospiraceae bacterium]
MSQPDSVHPAGGSYGAVLGANGFGRPGAARPLPAGRGETPPGAGACGHPQDTSYAPTDLVRVSIVLEDRPGLEQMEASSGLSTAALAVSPQMQQTRQSLEANQAALARRISNQVLGGEPLDVVWNLTLAANLISANVPYGKVEEIQAMPGVKTVVLETRYEPAVYSQGPADLTCPPPREMIGSSAAYAAGLTGAGTRIAVIDTGTDTDHQSFDAAAFAYALAEDAKNSGRTYDLLDEAEIREKLAQLNISRNGGPSAQELYVNEKLPFGYNYVDHDLDITHDHDDQGEHGSHVAGIATANRYIPSEDGYTDALTAVHVQGVAPDAQLLTMKVFGKNGGAYDSDYMAAIEDAILLGCDAVNLSLGSTSPGYATNAVYQDLLDRLSETDVVVSVAAGNAGCPARLGVSEWPSVQRRREPGYGGLPGSYTNALTVASADNVGYTGRYLTVQEQAIFYTETISRNKPLETLAGQPLEYVLVEGVGDDWTGIDLTGKVAVCARGTINFSEKANKAAEAGAVAVLIYNNVPGALSMDLSEYWYEPPVSPSPSPTVSGCGIKASSTPKPSKRTIGAKSSPEKSSTTPVN